MPDNTNLNGSVYHMVHISNVQSILSKGEILSKSKMISDKIKYSSIANEDVQGLRDRVLIWSTVLKGWMPLHSYVPFYFARLTPMLYVQHMNGLQDELVFFEVDRSIIDEPGVVFTDGNATIQQLAKLGTERVGIMPATKTSPHCRRRYFPEPQGTNANCSDVFSGSVFLDRLDWAVINSGGWGGDAEKKRIKHAEVLVPVVVRLPKIKGISTRTRAKADEVNQFIRKYNLHEKIPVAVSNPGLYFT